jgi:hypothetical protein
MFKLAYLIFWNLIQTPEALKSLFCYVVCIHSQPGGLEALMNNLGARDSGGLGEEAEWDEIVSRKKVEVIDRIGEIHFFQR